MRGIYCIRHIESGKMYIGSSINIERRLTDHKTKLKTSCGSKNRHHNTYLQAMWDKYGEKSFVFYIVEELPNLNTKSLRFKEQEIITELWDLDILFNFTKNTYCAIDDPLVEIKRREAHTKYFSNPENIEEFSLNTKLLWKNPDFSNRVKASIKESFEDGNRLEKMSEMTKNLWLIPKYKDAHTEYMLARWNTDKEYRLKMMQNWIKLSNSEDFKNARSKGVSKSMLDRWTNDIDFINKMEEGRKTWSNKPVKRLDTGEEFPSARIASISIGLNKAAVSVALGRNSRCDGTYWEYI